MFNILLIIIIFPPDALDCPAGYPSFDVNGFAYYPGNDMGGSYDHYGLDLLTLQVNI